MADREGLEPSIASLAEAIRLRPDHAPAHNNLGIALLRAGHLDEAFKSLRESIRLRPDHAATHANLGRALLLSGILGEGFTEYEWRLRQNREAYPAAKFKVWNGSSLKGKTILLRSEQGLGDTLQFARFAQILADEDARVILNAQPALRQLLKCLERRSIHITSDWDIPKVDLEVWLMSVANRLGTTLDNLPKQPPYLHADAVLIEQWAKQLPPISEGFRIGIAWQGNPIYPSDHQRSIPLKQFEPLVRLTGVRLISLQKGHGSEQLASFPAREEVIDLGPQLDEGKYRAFMDTAAVMMNLDLVITSDTAMAHLAGALGVPVWVALPFVPDWRWLLDRQDSPWYPTMRLFRQTRHGDWVEVFARIARELEGITAAKPQQSPVEISVGPGELADRHSIVRLKARHAGDADTVCRLIEQARELEQALRRIAPASALLDPLLSSLDGTNCMLWEAEDEIRACEKTQDFGPRFVAVVRSVCRLNDRRSSLKRSIDRLLGYDHEPPKTYTDRPHHQP